MTGYDLAGRGRRWPIAHGQKVGLGLFSNIADIDKDGDLDIIAPGKGGLYMFENLMKE